MCHKKKEGRTQADAIFWLHVWPLTPFPMVDTMEPHWWDVYRLRGGPHVAVPFEDARTVGHTGQAFLLVLVFYFLGPSVELGI